MITERAKPLALQAILFFIVKRMSNNTREQAIKDFLKTEICKAFDELTVGNVYGLAEAAGYSS